MASILRDKLNLGLVVILLGVLLAYGWAFTCMLPYEVQLPRRNLLWFFKGAYALYKGEAMGTFHGLPGGEPSPVLVREEIRLEVLEYNGTHVKLFFSGWEVQVIPYDGDWIELGKEFKIMGSVLTRVNETDIFVEGLGLRHTAVYEGHPGRITMFFDKEIWWPVKLGLSFNFHVEYDVELNLIETNIPGLKEA